MIDTEKAITAIKITDSLKEKKYVGYGYHGGGRKKAPEETAKTKTLSIVCSQSERDRIKELADKEGKTVSRFVVEKILD